ncbi:MAG: MFS transporter [Gammaproteobacteria bacterium]
MSSASPRPWRMLGLALLAQVAASIVAQGVPTLAPFLQADLSLTRAEVGMFNSALVAGSLLAMFGAGWVVDMKGERAALVWGTTVMGLACFAVLATHGFLTALAVLFAVGIGSAFPTPAGSKAVTSWFPIERRGLAMGVRQTGIPLGGALAAATLPHIAARFGWRVAVVLGGLGCLAAALACQAAYREPGSAPRAALSHHRLPRLADFLTRDILLLGMCGALATMGQFVLITYLAIFLKETQGIAVTTSATLLVFAQLAGAAGRILWGVASDRLFQHRRRPAFMLPIALSALGALALGWLPAGTPLTLIAALVMAQAFCTLGWHGNWIALVAEIAGPEKQGRTIGIAMSLMYPGIILLPPLFGWVVDRTHSWPGAWSALALVLLVSVLLILPVTEGTLPERRART